MINKMSIINKSKPAVAELRIKLLPVLTPYLCQLQGRSQYLGSGHHMTFFLPIGLSAPALSRQSWFLTLPRGEGKRGKGSSRCGFSNVHLSCLSSLTSCCLALRMCLNSAGCLLLPQPLGSGRDLPVHFAEVCSSSWMDLGDPTPASSVSFL